MSYQIAYDPQENARYPQKIKPHRKWLVKWIISAIFIAAAGYIALSSNVLHYILPGDPEVTTVAFSQMIEQVRTGESVKDAIVCFVEQVVIHGA